MCPGEELSTGRSTAREDVGFLTSSWNRFDVLEAVSQTSRSRDELLERIDVSRVTLSRILSDLESRDWITRRSNRFEATADGVFVADEVSRLLDNLTTADELGRAIEWLPTDQFDFDVKHLRDVTIITPDQEDLTAPTRKLIDLAHRCSRIRAIPTGITHEFIAALRDATVDGDLSVELLLPPDVLDIVSDDPDVRRRFLDMGDSGQADIFHYRGDSPLTMMGIFDDEVMVCGHGEGEVPAGTIKTTNEVIRSWAESYFSDRRAEARRLDAEMFTA